MPSITTIIIVLCYTYCISQVVKRSHQQLQYYTSAVAIITESCVLSSMIHLEPMGGDKYASTQDQGVELVARGQSEGKADSLWSTRDMMSCTSTGMSVAHMLVD